MMKFVNPFTAGRRISDLEVERDLYESCYNNLFAANKKHRETNGNLRAELTATEAAIDSLLESCVQQEQAVFFHMEERKDLLEVIEDLEEELEDLADTLEDLEDECDEYVDCIVTLVSENQLLNELLVEGSASYDRVVEAGKEMAAGFDEQMRDAESRIQWMQTCNDADLEEVEEARKTSARELDYAAHCARVAKEDRDDAQQDLAIAERELEALKLANTQSLSWVRQAAEALDAYGITIEDTPVGPAVQIDRDAFVNRIALDNVSAA